MFFFQQFKRFFPLTTDHPSFGWKVSSWPRFFESNVSYFYGCFKIFLFCFGFMQFDYNKVICPLVSMELLKFVYWLMPFINFEKKSQPYFFKYSSAPFSVSFPINPIIHRFSLLTSFLYSVLFIFLFSFFTTLDISYWGISEFTNFIFFCVQRAITCS